MGSHTGSASQSPVAQPERPQPVLREQRMVAALPAHLKRYTEQECPSGLRCYRSLEGDADDDQFVPSGLAATLTAGYEAAVILHFQKAGIETPEDIADPIALLDWLPDESAIKFGPILVPYASLYERGQLEYIDQLWEQDGCLIFLGHDRGTMIDHLRQLIHQAVPNFSAEGGLFYYCWPSVLGQLLEAQPAETTEAIMTGSVEAVLMEAGPAETGWRIFGSPAYRQALRAAGFQLTVPPPSSAAGAAVS